MSDGRRTDDYLCPYETCEYSAPTERQVRSHVTFADHGDHDGVNGYSISVEVPDCNGDVHSYEDKNKVNLEEISPADITDQVGRAEQVILEIAYNNPKKNYSEIHEIAEKEKIDYSYSKVRNLIKTHIETGSAEPNIDPETTQRSETTTESVAAEPVPLTDRNCNPFTASPYNAPRSSEKQQESQTSEDTEAESDAKSDRQTTESQSANNRADEQRSQQVTTAGDSFPYDTTAVADYWSERQGKIVAAYRAMDDPSPGEVHSKLTDELNVDIERQYVQKTIGSVTTEYDELNDKQKQAIEAMAEWDGDDSLATIADQAGISDGYLKYIRSMYPHILTERGIEPATVSRLPDAEALTFPIKDDLDQDTWTQLQQVIISGYEAFNRPTDSELKTRLDGMGIDVAQSTIKRTLSAYTDIDRREDQLQPHEKTYTDLNDRQKSAVDGIAETPPETPILSLAEDIDESARYLYYINDDFQHIIENRRQRHS